MMKPYISVVSPIYKAEKIVHELVRRIVLNVEKITPEYEVILVCDGSPDNSWQAIKDECAANPRVVGVNLSRNFGQHYALSAALSKARGEWVYVLDCDLQDRPEEFERLYNKAVSDGLDYVVARRVGRKDGFLKRLSSTTYNYVYGKLSGLKADKTIANYGIYNRRVVDAFNEMKDVSRSFQSLLAYVGFRWEALDVEHSERYEGKSSYSWGRLIRLSLDIILSNSNIPLKLAIQLGAVMTVIAMAMVLYNLVVFLVSDVIPGFSATIISIWFVGGIIVFILGIVGLYIDKIFNQVKARPIYIISEVINGEA